MSGGSHCKCLCISVYIPTVYTKTNIKILKHLCVWICVYKHPKYSGLFYGEVRWCGGHGLSTLCVLLRSVYLLVSQVVVCATIFTCWCRAYGCWLRTSVTLQWPTVTHTRTHSMTIKPKFVKVQSHSFFTVLQTFIENSSSQY